MDPELYEKLNNLLKEIEADLGVDCKLEITPSRLSPITIGEFNSVEIYDAIENYKELEGKYGDMNNLCDISKVANILVEKYAEERFSRSERYNHRDGVEIVGVCKLCNQWKSPGANTYFNLTNDGINIYHEKFIFHKNCQFCDADWTIHKYYGLFVSYDSDFFGTIRNIKNECIAKYRRAH